MKSYRSPKVEVRANSIEGNGIFAREHIHKGEIVCAKGGHILDVAEFESTAPLLKKYCLQIEDDLFRGPRNEAEIPENALYINHSCDPNVGFQGQLTYVALREIEAGEELTHDYAMCYTTDSALPAMNCWCKNDHCRGVITSNDWQLHELQARYGAHFVSFILRKIGQLNQVTIPCT